MSLLSEREPLDIDVSSPEPVCIHCGDPCEPGSLQEDGKYFCCTGCRTVYTILHNSDLSEYYDIENNPGLKPVQSGFGDRFAYLDDNTIRDALLDFCDGNQSRVTLSIPQIHCSACIWLLENLYGLQDGIISSRVDFSRRELSVSFAADKISLRELVELLASIGYAPEIRLTDLESKPKDKTIRTLYGRLALAGFCFGNVMLLSFPHYLGLGWLLKTDVGRWFDLLKVILAVPVVFYSAQDFFKTAWNGLRQRQINMDVPISIGITILFARSLFEIILLGQPGYMDSLCALVFLLLIGRLYQKKTYRALSKNGDFRSYLPIAVIKKDGPRETAVPIDNLKPGDHILVRNQELVPADSILRNGHGHIDYSFVTGEASPVSVSVGQRIFAGGRQVGPAVELEVIKKPLQSYLMQLWSQTNGSIKEQPRLVSLATKISQVFTPTVILIALAAGIFWLWIDGSRALDAATAVLIVACPCALALSTPFALGTAHRLCGRNNLFLKDGNVIERLASITRVVFDKTGTITYSDAEKPEFVGETLMETEKRLIYSAVRQSAHPLSVRLSNYLCHLVPLTVESFDEVTGQGLAAIIDGHDIRIGSWRWVQGENAAKSEAAGVYVAIDGKIRGNFRFANLYRKGLKDVIARLNKRFPLALLSGDHDSERRKIAAIFPGGTEMKFRESPADKLNFVQNHVMRGERVLMVGDGINDMAALAAATVGITVMENGTAFSPKSDGVLKAGQFRLLPGIMDFSRDCLTIIKASFGLSFLYNAIGLFFAAQGALSPLIAAVLMPASSVTVVLFVTLMTVFQARRRGVV